MEKNDRYEIVTNVIESLENGGSFNQRDREKFAQTARTLGIEDSVIEEMIDIYQLMRDLPPLVRCFGRWLGLSNNKYL
ncbi:hypothetical protein KVL69_03645 [Helicobacter pylori]|nr:hypothetical protein KVL69_03645 [Helicobacter pylori]